MNMNQLLTLLQREFWEYKGSFLMLPLVVTGFLITCIILVMIVIGVQGSTGEDADSQISAGKINENTIVLEEDETSIKFRHRDDMGDKPFQVRHFEISLSQLRETIMAEMDRFSIRSKNSKSRTMQKYLNAAAKPLLFFLWAVLFFYLLSSLYEERKDRSILFWKSMPVSDLMTVGSKLLTAMVVAPIITIIFIMLLQLTMLLALSIVSLGQDFSIWDTFWAPSNLLATWLGYLVGTGFIALWCLPFFGWLILVSAFARAIPWAWAIGVPIAILVLEKISFYGDHISVWMGSHAFGMGYLVKAGFDGETLLDMLFSLDMISALVVGLAMIAGAVWLRGRSEEI